MLEQVIVHGVVWRLLATLQFNRTGTSNHRWWGGRGSERQLSGWGGVGRGGVPQPGTTHYSCSSTRRRLCAVATIDPTNAKQAPRDRALVSCQPHPVLPVPREDVEDCSWRCCAACFHVCATQAKVHCMRPRASRRRNGPRRFPGSTRYSTPFMMWNCVPADKEGGSTVAWRRPGRQQAPVASLRASRPSQP